MADSRFFARHGPFTLSEIVEELGVTAIGSREQLAVLYEDIGPIGDAGSRCISFLFNRRYVSALQGTKAGAVLLEESFASRVPDGCVALVSRRPYYDFARLSQMFYPIPEVEPGVHPSAQIDDSASIGDGVRIDAGAVVSAGAAVGAGAWVGANAVIDIGVTIGPKTRIGAGAYIGYADVGGYCQIHPGVRIGTRGFGFAIDPSGHVDIPQLGRVKIGDDVEVGANSCIDRGMGPDTVIGDGCRIDNLVQIGHNVQMGRGCVLAGQVGIAGSAKLEDFVICGAQSGIAGHITLGTGVQIAAKSGVIRDLAPGDKVGGLPAVPLRDWLRQHAVINDLTRQKRQNKINKNESSDE